MNQTLPSHIIEVIFSKIPITNLPNCRSVCKYWNDLIIEYAKYSKISPNTYFLCTFSAPSLHYIDLDPNRLERTSSTQEDSNDDWSFYKIIDSCNGLILLLRFRIQPRKEEYGIFNPMTNEYMKLPISKEEEEIRSRIYHYGFGYSLKTKCYKVARVYFNTELRKSVFEIFSFGENKNKQSWSCSCIDENVVYHVFENGVYFDGALYWVGMYANEENRDFICRLDMDSERVETVLSFTGMNEVYIRGFNGSIYGTALRHSPHSDHRIEVWKLQRFRGKDSWNREIVLYMPQRWIIWSFKFQLIKDCEDGETFTLFSEDKFIFYNTKFERIKSFDKELSVKFLSIHQIQSLNFGSLPMILAKDDR